MTDFSDFNDDDVLIIQGQTGIAISAKKQRFILFRRNITGMSYSWEIITEQPLGKMRGARKVDGFVNRPAEFRISRGGATGAARDVGSAVGGAIRDVADARKIRNETGIIFDLEYFDEPEFFVHIADNKRRSQAIECIRQIFAGKEPGGFVRDIDDKVASSFPTKEMKKRCAEQSAARQQKKKRLFKYAVFASPFIIAGIIAALYYIDEINRRDRKMGHYIGQLKTDPDVLASAQREECEMLHEGYERALVAGDRKSTHATHSDSSYSRFKFNNGSNCYPILVRISDNDHYVQATKGSQNCSPERIGPSTRTPLQLEDMKFFIPLREPTCTP